MCKNPVKKKLRKGKASIGAWIIIDHPAIGEILADAGFDWIALDGEHSQFTIESMRTILQAASRTSVVPIIRVAWNDPVRIKQILDIGPEGIIIPMVNTAEEAQAAVRACLYPPQGIRGVGVSRAQRYGIGYKDYIENANENLIICLQIEHMEGVKNIEKILSVKGIDAIFIGRADLAASMGMPGGEDRPQVWREVDKVFNASKKAGIAVGLFLTSPEEAAKRVTEGYQFIGLGSDVSFLVSTAQQSYTRCMELLKGRR